MFEKIKKSITDKLIKNFLVLYPAQGQQFTIQEHSNLESDIAIYKIWYRGDESELNQLYHQIDDETCSFWSSTPTRGLDIRKCHVGIPSQIVQVLTNLTVADFEDVKISDAESSKIWEEITKNINFSEILKEAISSVLVCGDGAFKISYNSEISKYPFLDFIDGDRIELIKKDGKIQEIIFKTLYEEAGKNYILKEHYGKGYITHELIDGNVNVPLTRLKETAELQDIYWSGDFMMCSYLRFFISNKYKDRGQSIYSGKLGNFDALDEVWSQWIEATRICQPKTYIPLDMIPRDENGNLLKPNKFDNRFIALESRNAIDDNGQITTVAPTFQYEGYCQTYITALDNAIQGIISACTLGIDTKKIANAEAQREREKATLYTRQAIVQALQKTLPEIIQIMLNTYNLSQNKEIKETEISCPFGEYLNPSFESQVETVVKAKEAGVMSIEAAVEELYGDRESEIFKKEEIARLYKMNNMTTEETPPAPSL